MIVVLESVEEEPSCVALSDTGDGHHEHVKRRTRLSRFGMILKRSQSSRSGDNKKKLDIDNIDHHHEEEQEQPSTPSLPSNIDNSIPQEDNNNDNFNPSATASGRISSASSARGCSVAAATRRSRSIGEYNLHPGYTQSIYEELTLHSPPPRSSPTPEPYARPNSAHASPLSSYNRGPLEPGSPPGVPLSPGSPRSLPSLCSFSSSSSGSTIMSSSMSMGGPAGYLPNGLPSDRMMMRRDSIPEGDELDLNDTSTTTTQEEAVSAQIRDLADRIVSPVPQRRVAIVNDGGHHQGHPSSSSDVSSYPQRSSSNMNAHVPHYGHIGNTADHTLEDDMDDMTMDDAARGMQSNPYHQQQQQPSITEAWDHSAPLAMRSQQSHQSQSSFSIIEPSSALYVNKQQGNTSPKPKLRNLDTSLGQARNKVSSFFGGSNSQNLEASSEEMSPYARSQSQQTPTHAHPYPSYPPSSSTSGNNAYPQASSSSSVHPHVNGNNSMNGISPNSVPQTRSFSQPLQNQYYPSHPQRHLGHGVNPSTSSNGTNGTSSLHPQQQQQHQHQGRNSFYGLDGNQGQQSYEGEQRWRSERRASPSARPVSQSIPPRSHDMSGNGHYTSPSLGGGASASSSFGGYAGSNEVGGPRRRMASSTSRSAASSIYGVNMVSSPSSGGVAAGSSSQDGYAAPAELPLVPPVAHLTQAHLRPGQGVSLLSHQKTLDMYRANVKKTNDPEITFELAQFMLGIAREMASMDNNERSMLGGGGMHHGASEENLLSSLHDGDGSSSPSPDPSFSFHSRSSGSSGDLASAAVAARMSSQGTSPSGQAGQKRSAHSPAPSMSGNGHRLQAVNMHRTGSPTSSSANVNDRRALIAEAISLLKRSADRGHTDSQYFLADIYANGSFMGVGSSSSSNNAASTSVAMGRRESSGNRLTSTRQSIYNLIPGAHHDKNNQQQALGTSPGSGSVSSLEIMRQNPSPTGSNVSLSAPGMQHSASSHGLMSSSSSQGTHMQGNISSRPDYDKALPLFIAAAKHGHAPSCYRAGQCFENGWGCRKDSTKAVSFYRKSAAASFPEAMYRLGMAELNGELGMKDRQKEGFKWLKQVAALAEGNNVNNDNSQDGNLTSSPSGGGGFALDDTDGSSHSNNNNSSAARLCTVQALHELALLHERGIHNVVFVDNEYAAELLARASELGYAPSAYKLGECYEYGKMGCPQDAALSIHYYNIAAQQNHKEACFALTAWYLVGSPGVLPQSDTEAYLWAKKAAEQGLAKAEYAVGYFTEVGIGTIRDERDAISWFKKAAEHGDKRAITRLKTLGVNFESPDVLSPTKRSPSSPRDLRAFQNHSNDKDRHSTADMLGPKSAVTRGRAAGADTPNANPGKSGTSDYGGSNASKRKSRRNTLPGLMGMSNKTSSQSNGDVPPVPNNGTAGKKDADCIIS